MTSCRYSKKKREKKNLLVMRTLGSTLLASFCHIAVLTIAIMWYITPLALMYLITRVCPLLPPSSNSSFSLIPLPLVTTNLIFLCGWCFVCLDSTYKWDHAMFVFVCLCIYIYTHIPLRLFLYLGCNNNNVL